MAVKVDSAKSVALPKALFMISNADETFRLGMIQTPLVWEEPGANRRHLAKLLAKADQADLILLPEMFTTGFSMQAEMLAEEAAGPTLTWLQEQAALHHCAISGSVMVKENGAYFNRLYFVYPNGDFKQYDKRHLFTLAGEQNVYTAGSEKLVLEYKGWRINPQICYDLRFPVWCRNTEDFDLQFFVANWPERRSEAWIALLKARAIENQCYLAGLNRLGEDGNGIYHSGDSAIHDPMGTKLSETEAHVETVEVVELYYSQLKRLREKFGFLKDRDAFEIRD